MTAWVLLIGAAVAVVGVVVKVGRDVVIDLRRDRAEHGGRQTVAAARRAIVVASLIAVLVIVLIVWPLVLGDD